MLEFAALRHIEPRDQEAIRADAKEATRIFDGHFGSERLYHERIPTGMSNLPARARELGLL